MTHSYARLLGGLLFLLALALPAQAAEVIPASVEDGAVVWTPQSEYAQALLTLSTASGVEYRRAFDAGEAVRMHPSEIGELPLADGFYTYRLTLTVNVPDADEPTANRSQVGMIEVQNGAVVPSALLDQVIQDDLIVVGSECVGTDCNSGENFGFDTLRLKENNLRIRFQDTSNSAGFPTRDWEIQINSQNNGGADYFAILDIDGGKTPFLIEANARNNALYLDDNSRLGLGTSTPGTDIDIKTGNTPTVRLQQDGSSGFTAQTWDLAGNEANFFLRDVGSGDLPFRVKPGAAENSIFIDTDGVGINNANPDVALDVTGEIQATTNVRIGGIFGAFGNFLATPNNFVLDLSDISSGLTRLFGVAGDGDVTARGTINAGGDITTTADMNAVAFNTTSDATLKENVTPVDAEAVLAGVAALPISTWEFIGDQDDTLHLGPMAQDFSATFGLGAYTTRIATVDADGVALASIQALHARNEAATARIAELEAANAALEARLARLEALIEATHE